MALAKIMVKMVAIFNINQFSKAGIICNGSVEFLMWQNVGMDTKTMSI